MTVGELSLALSKIPPCGRNVIIHCYLGDGDWGGFAAQITIPQHLTDSHLERSERSHLPTLSLVVCRRVAMKGLTLQL